MIRNHLGVSLLAGLVLISGCAKKEPIRETRTLLGTVVTISVFDTDKPEDVIRNAVEQAFGEITRVEGLMWYKAENSDVKKINDQAGVRSATVSDETFQVIMEALKMFDKTDEAFDIRVGPVVQAWGFDADHPSIPDPATLEKAREAAAMGGIFVAGQSIMLGKEGMALDLSGIAKGYAVERATKLLADRGIQSAIVEAGGDLKTLGTRDSKGTKWHIAIRHPRKAGGYWGIMDILDGAVATSGDYENYFEQDGKRYCHIIDPKTGYPADKCVSVTVWGDNAMRCDALVTGMFVLGPDSGLSVLQTNFPSYNAMFVFQAGDSLKTAMTSGFEKVFRAE